MQPTAEGAPVGLGDRQRFGEPAGDGGVVGGDAGEGLGRQLLPEAVGQRAAMRPQRREQRAVVGRVGDDRHIGVVLGRRAQHGRAAYVDVLDRGRVVAAGAAHLLERVEVDDREVDRADAVRLHGRRVPGVVADRQQAAMHGRVQRLDAAVHDLGEAGQVGYVARSNARRGDGLRRAAGRNELDLHGRQLGSEPGEPGLVGDGDQSAADGDEIGRGDLLGGDGHRQGSGTAGGRLRLTQKGGNGNRCLGVHAGETPVDLGEL